MKNTTKTALTLLALGASAWMATAQDGSNPPPRGERPPRHARPDGPPPGEDGPGGPGGPGAEGHRPPPPPLIAALDANRDGMIDATEIANASAALKTLDKNGDGKLTRDELHPPRPDGAEGPPHRRGPRPPEGGAQQPPPSGQEPPGGPGGPGPEGHRPPLPPIIAALDANHDGVIDEAELANASAALKTLDKNGDGKLTMDELRPPRPEGAEGPPHHRGPRPPEGDAQQPPPPGQ